MARMIKPFFRRLYLAEPSSAWGADKFPAHIRPASPAPTIVIRSWSGHFRVSIELLAAHYDSAAG